MPDTKSEPTLIVEALTDAMYEMYKELKEAWPEPFGMERITSGEYKKRFGAMTREQRLAEIGRVGVDGILKLMRGEK